MVKYAFLDKGIYQLLTHKENLSQLVYVCVDYKRMIVEKDEFEGGLRKLLNLGHTIAHGREKISEYTISHGKAVVMGINVILNASLKHGYIDKKVYTLLKQVLELNTTNQLSPYNIESICDACLQDKKRSGEDITLIMVYGIGDCRPVKVNVKDLKEYLS